MGGSIAINTTNSTTAGGIGNKAGVRNVRVVLYEEALPGKTEHGITVGRNDHISQGITTSGTTLASLTAARGPVFGAYSPLGPLTEDKG